MGSTGSVDAGGVSEDTATPPANEQVAELQAPLVVMDEIPVAMDVTQDEDDVPEEALAEFFSDGDQAEVLQEDDAEESSDDGEDEDPMVEGGSSDGEDDVEYLEGERIAIEETEAAEALAAAQLLQLAIGALNIVCEVHACQPMNRSATQRTTCSGGG